MRTKWEAGEATSHSKESIARSKRLQTIVSEYATRDTITYLKGVAHNFTFYDIKKYELTIYYVCLENNLQFISVVST